MLFPPYCVVCLGCKLMEADSVSASFWVWWTATHIYDLHGMGLLLMDKLHGTTEAWGWLLSQCGFSGQWSLPRKGIGKQLTVGPISWGQHNAYSSTILREIQGTYSSVQSSPPFQDINIPSSDRFWLLMREPWAENKGVCPRDWAHLRSPFYLLQNIVLLLFLGSSLISNFCV